MGSVNTKTEVTGDFIDNSKIQELLEKNLKNRLAVLATKMAKNVASSTPKNFIIPNYRSKPGGGKYFSNAKNDETGLKEALSDVQNQVVINIGLETSIGLGKPSVLDAATRKHQGTGGYWRLFEGWGKFHGGPKPGSSPDHAFQPIDGATTAGGEGYSRSLPSIRLKNIKNVKVLSPHPGVQPLQMFHLTKTQYTQEFRKTIRDGLVDLIKDLKSKRTRSPGI